jgi:HD superfamily phosphohydrolase YqeK
LRIDGSTVKWHSLDEHLTNTAELAKSFADAFKAGEWAYLAGLWHDIKLEQLSKGR